MKKSDLRKIVKNNINESFNSKADPLADVIKQVLKSEYKDKDAYLADLLMNSFKAYQKTTLEIVEESLFNIITQLDLVHFDEADPES